MMVDPKTERTRLILGGVFLVLLAFGAGVLIAPAISLNGSFESASSSAVGIDITPLYTAWHLLDQNFAPATTTKALTAEEKLWGAIQGLAATYGDDYTVFFPPKEKEVFETSVQGNFEGVGMEIAIKDGVLTVVSPLKNTPAARAGIKSGDLILKIDGESTENLTVEEAVQKIRGEGGTAVTLTLSRDGNPPFDVSVVRATITLPTIDTELRTDGVFVIRLYMFNAIAPQMFQNAVREFANSGSDKLVIDLRGNPGGFLEVAVDLASWFLPVGKPIVIEEFGQGGGEQIYRSRGYDVFTDHVQIAILMDGGSASASEIFAGALHDYGKATLIGTQSFGKGSVQQLFDVTPETSLKITIARWLTPNRVSISLGGLTPDIVVERTEEDLNAEKDSQMERAVEFLKTGK